MTNSEYWKKRAEERKNHVSRTADEAAEEARESFERARHRINREVAYWIQKFADAEGISYDEARKMLEAGELEQFRMTLGEYIARGKALDVDPEWQDAMVKASALHHIDRLNALKAIIRAELEENKARLKRSQWMHDIADYSYEHTLFGIETGLEMQIRFRQPDLDRLHRDIEEAWAPDGIDFVDRVGINNDKLAAEVDRLLTQGMITGETYEELAKQLTDQFALKEYEAARIIRTEATRVASMSEAAAYQTAGLEEYEILVTLDERTCSICGPMDGHVERVDDMEPGVTAPPFHPNCRCTTIGHYEDDLIGETRIARDEDGNPIHVDGDMTWEEWKKSYDDRIKDGLNRRTNNGWLSPILKIPMQKRAIKRIAKKYGIDLSGLKIRIHRGEEWLHSPFAGVADPKDIGRIDFLPNAFRSEEELVRTLLHEMCHVKQFKKYGNEYVQNNKDYMEDIADRFEEIWYNLVRKKARV